MDHIGIIPADAPVLKETLCLASYLTREFQCILPEAAQISSVKAYMTLSGTKHVGDFFLPSRRALQGSCFYSSQWSENLI